MEKVLLSIIAASVLCVVSSHVQRQYHFVYEVKNMTEAQRYCRDRYTDLATIYNEEDVKNLTDMVDLSKMVLDEYGWPTAWIGLYCGWRWSDRDAEVEFTNWANNEPNNDGNGQYCTLMFGDGKWYDADCALTRQAVCSSVTGSDVKFILILRPMSWTEAQNYCRANYTDLATVRNEVENQEVKNLTGGEIVWIGLFSGSWTWSDGSKSSFRYWASGVPNNNDGKEDCVAINFDSSGRWQDWICARDKPFICYKEIVHKMRVSVKMNSALDPNNPEVMEEVLKQLKQRLKEKGVNEDVKLSWKKQPDGKVFHEEKKKKKKRNISKKDEL
ncbi:macrophage mannose receptor 1-like [Scomber scombrus]|uniref:Macrophage mannose receptor 1-like n=1 Tax=Scomber scombrus TaxID=13677 RepID=A0AAV1QDH6_SCOSC